MYDDNQSKAMEALYAALDCLIHKAKSDKAPTVLTVPDLAWEYAVAVGIAKDQYEEIGEENVKMLEEELGLTILPIKATGQEEMIRELERATQGQKVIAALLDVTKDVATRDGIRNLLVEFKAQAVRDVIELTNPEISKLTDKNVKRIENIDKMRKTLVLLARLLPEGRSYRLSESSIYEIRANRIYQMFREDYSEALKDYLAASRLAENQRRYTVTAVDNVFDLKMLAESIGERREAMEITLGKEDPIQDFVIIRNDKVTKENLENVLLATGLSSYVTPDRVILVEEGVTVAPAELLEEISERTGTLVQTKEVVIGQKAQVIEVDKDNPGEMFSEVDGFMYVEIGGDHKTGLASQLYKLMLELAANGSFKPMNGTVNRVGNYNFYIYLPKIEVIDLEKEVKAYERYVIEILVKA
jgi:hypothetical protein